MNKGKKYHVAFDCVWGRREKILAFEEEKRVEADRLIAFYYQEYVKEVMPEEENFVLFNLFQKKSVKKQKSGSRLRGMSAIFGLCARDSDKSV